MSNPDPCPYGGGGVPGGIDKCIRHAHENQLSHVNAVYRYNSAHPGTNLSEDAVHKWRQKGLITGVLTWMQ